MVRIGRVDKSASCSAGSLASRVWAYCGRCVHHSKVMSELAVIRDLNERVSRLRLNATNARCKVARLALPPWAILSSHGGVFREPYLRGGLANPWLATATDRTSRKKADTGVPAFL